MKAGDGWVRQAEWSLVPVVLKEIAFMKCSPLERLGFGKRGAGWAWAVQGYKR